MGKRRSLSAPLVIAGLIVFILVDLALVVFALNPRGDDGSSSAAQATFTPLPSISATAKPTPSSQPTASASAPAATPSSTGTTSSSPTPSPTSTAPTGTPLQGFADKKVGYRATAGSCSGPDAVIQLTTDGGATWTDVTPTTPRIREVDSIIVVDTDHVDLLAKYGDSCTLSAVSTYTQGQYWQAYPDRTAQLQQ